MPRVLFETIDQHLGKITLNDPDNLNAMGEEMAAEFRALVQEIGSGKSSGLRAIVLTGSGRAFSAGGNLTMLEEKRKLSKDENKRRMLDFYNSFLSILDLEIPLIAAINGHAIGAGLCVAMACDLRIAAAEAKLGFTFVKLGLHPGMGATYFVPRVAGAAAANDLLLAGRVIDAAEAQRLGLVSRVSPAGEVLEHAMVMAREIASNGPISVKQLLHSLRGGSGKLKEALTREAECQAENYAGQEFAEGVRAAIEKRTPNF